MAMNGRAFLALAGRGVRGVAGGSGPTPPVRSELPRTTPMQLEGSADTGRRATDEAARLARLEARVDALERVRER